MRKLKQYLTNAALISGGTVTLLLAITALDLLADTAARIAAAIMALGFMALISKLPNPASGRHARGN